MIIAKFNGYLSSSLEELGNIDLLFLTDSDDVRSLFNSSPRAVSLNGKVVTMHLDAEESALAPVGSPTVTTNPELNSILLAPSNHSDLVVDGGQQLGL
jgi:hypothetical protein